MVRSFHDASIGELFSVGGEVKDRRVESGVKRGVSLGNFELVPTGAGGLASLIEKVGIGNVRGLREDRLHVASTKGGGCRGQ